LFTEATKGVVDGLPREPRTVYEAERLPRETLCIGLHTFDELCGQSGVVEAKRAEAERATKHLLDFGGKLVVVTHLPVGVGEILNERRPARKVRKAMKG
jgi:hypothetical protein